MKQTLIAITFVAIFAAHAAMADVLTIPAGLERIDPRAFMNDTALDQVVFPEGLQSIGSQSFANSSVKTVYFADSLIDIAEDAFEGCNLDAFVNENTYAYEYCVRKGFGVFLKTNAQDYKGNLLIYTSLCSDLVEAEISAFNVMYPNIEVSVYIDGTHLLLEKIAGERAAPQAGVLWGGFADSIDKYKDCFQPYRPSNIDSIETEFYDPQYYWIGQSATPLVLLMNTNFINEEDIPATWSDLLDSVWKEKIIIKDPSETSAGFISLCTLLMCFGDKNDDYEEGWKCLEQIRSNFVICITSSNLLQKVNSGECPIGIITENDAMQFIKRYKASYLKTIYPKEGTSVIPECIAVVKDCPREDLAKLFEEFILSKEGQSILQENCNFRPIRKDIKPKDFLPLESISTISFDYDFVVNNETDIIEKWQDILIE